MSGVVLESVGPRRKIASGDVVFKPVPCGLKTMDLAEAWIGVSRLRILTPLGVQG